jgi:hypothetical protein
MKKGLLLIFFAVLSVPGFSLDFGVILNQNVLYEAENTDGYVDYGVSVGPWLQSPLGTKAKLYLSGVFTMQYEGEDEEWIPIPEAARFGFVFFPQPSMYFEVGRQGFKDLLGIIAMGYYDGLSASFSFPWSRLHLGAFYTGLLYKETAHIIVTDGAGKNDRHDYDDPDNYFASRRILGSARWDIPILAPRTSLSVQGLGQFDLNGREDWLNSQYFSILCGYTPQWKRGFVFSLGGTVGLAESSRQDLLIHLAGQGKLEWLLPVPVQSMLSLKALWSSGEFNELIGPFIPIATISQGKVFTPKLSGLCYVRAAYTVKPGKTLSLEAEGSYFFRTDNRTFTDVNLEPGSAAFLGPELYVSFQWGPAPDFLFTLGSGAFFPGLGDAFVSGTPPRWNLRAGLVISI